MSKIIRAAVVTVLVAVPTFGAAAGASATVLANGIGWDRAPMAAAAGAPAQTDGIGWDQTPTGAAAPAPSAAGLVQANGIGWD